VSFNVTLKLVKTSFKQGRSRFGGAIYISGLSNIIIESSTFTNNKAFYDGGAIYASGFSGITISDSNFAENRCA
jgi:predicted outer membrane repeat protein